MTRNRKVNPEAEIKDPLGNPFVSLRDSAIAVDDVTGDVYFADNTQPHYTEKPQATIYVYGSTNTYKGHLKYNITDALPPGLAVDNSQSDPGPRLRHLGQHHPGGRLRLCARCRDSPSAPTLQLLAGSEHDERQRRGGGHRKLAGRDRLRFGLRDPDPLRRRGHPRRDARSGLDLHRLVGRGLLGHR